MIFFSDISLINEVIPGDTDNINIYEGVAGGVRLGCEFKVLSYLFVLEAAAALILSWE